MVMHTCMISLPPVISYSVLKSMQKLRLVASLVDVVRFCSVSYTMLYFGIYPRYKMQGVEGGGGGERIK